MVHSAKVGRNDLEGPAGMRTAPLFLTVFLVALGVCLFDLADARKFLGDVDDLMREVQIRYLLSADGNWWDLSLPMIALPEPYVSPWSRLVDAPYVAITYLLSPLVGRETAIDLAFDIWPLIMLCIFSLQCAAIYRRMAVPASVFGYIVVASATMLMAFALWEFVPGRIDHHNAQIIALMTVLCGLARWDRAGGRLVGAGTLGAVVISLEGVPFVAVVYAGLVAAMFARKEGAAVMLKQAGAILVCFTVPLALVFVGPSSSLSTQCDAFSAPYIVLLLGFGTILFVVAHLSSVAGWPVQLLFLAVSSLALTGAFPFLFPTCLGGPYWMIDPVSKSLWLDRVAQEHSALYFIEQGQIAIVILAIILAAVLTFASVGIAGRRAHGFAGLLLILFIAWVSLILTLVLTRYIRFAFAFAPLFVPLATRFFLDRPMDRVARVSRQVALGIVAAYMLIAGWLAAATPNPAPVFDAADYMAYDACPQGNLAAVVDHPAGTIAAPAGIGLPLIAAMPAGFSVAAIPFHRASPGMRRVFDAFTTADPAVRRAALAPFDYVAVCLFPFKTDYGTAPLYDALSAGEDWPGLIRLPTGADNPFQLFRIDHAVLQ